MFLKRFIRLGWAGKVQHDYHTLKKLKIEFGAVIRPYIQNGNLSQTILLHQDKNQIKHFRPELVLPFIYFMAIIKFSLIYKVYLELNFQIEFFFKQLLRVFTIIATIIKSLNHAARVSCDNTVKSSYVQKQIFYQK